MGNDHFSFKQFTVKQDRCAMKISTDACIQGAWAPVAPTVKRVLDIGAGTGLLSLMLAQKSPGIIIDAIEYEDGAVLQAEENVALSPWAGRIKILKGDARTFKYEHRYDMIISNPPFFTNSLTGPKPTRNMARHSDTLSLHDLFIIISSYLDDRGYACIILPPESHSAWEKIAENSSLGFEKILFVHPREGQRYNRVISICRKDSSGTIEEHIAIKNRDNSYTESFIELLKPYYLYL